MPVFTTNLPSAAEEFPYQLQRTPPNGALVAVVSSTQLLGTYTHFINNRTIPCTKPRDCEPCEEGIQKRFHVYLTAIRTDTFEHFIFETTAAGADPFKNYLRMVSEIRACHFKASRPSGKQNGRIRIVCKQADLTKIRLPDPPNVARLMCHIWNVPYDPADAGPSISTEVAEALAKRSNAHPKPNGEDNSTGPLRLVQ